jgi:DNA-binding transcriptional regulator YdaS (Cro superfamily)
MVNSLPYQVILMLTESRRKQRQYAAGMRALRKAKEIIGTETAIAKVVGVSQPSMHEMLKSGLKVPAEWCIPIDIETSRLAAIDARKRRISCHQLRGDIYPDQNFIPAEAQSFIPQEPQQLSKTQPAASM